MACTAVGVMDTVGIAAEEACADGDEEGDAAEVAVELEGRWWEDKTLCDTSRIYPAENDPMRWVMSASALRIWIFVGRSCISKVAGEQRGRRIMLRRVWEFPCSQRSCRLHEVLGTLLAIAHVVFSRSNMTTQDFNPNYRLFHSKLALYL